MLLKKKRTRIKNHHCLEFLIISLLLLPFLYFFWHLSPEALELKNIFIFFLVILFSMIANLLVFYSVKGDKISNLEPAKILEPLFVISLALLFGLFIDHEKYSASTKIIYPSLIACIALVLSHVKGHHLTFNKYFIAAMLGSLFFGLELVTSRLILDYYSSFSFYFLRCFSLFLIGVIFLRPKLKDVDKKIYLPMTFLGGIWVFYRIVVYYGYIHLGIISTTLVFLLSPIFVYAFAWGFLKERPTWKNICASIVILCCVVYGTLSH